MCTLCLKNRSYTLKMHDRILKSTKLHFISLLLVNLTYNMYMYREKVKKISQLILWIDLEKNTDD